MSHLIDARKLAKQCVDVARAYGGILPKQGEASPLDIAFNAGDNTFAHGVIACAAHFAIQIKSAAGAKSLEDLLLQPGNEAGAATAPSSLIAVTDLVDFCTSSSIVAGGYLPFEALPASGLGIEQAAQNDPFKRGVLVCLSDLLNFIRSRTGTEALKDLVLEPGGQQVERPGSGGRDD